MRSLGACIYALEQPRREGVVFEERTRDFIPHTVNPTPYASSKSFLRRPRRATESLVINKSVLSNFIKGSSPRVTEVDRKPEDSA